MYSAPRGRIRAMNTGVDVEMTTRRLRQGKLSAGNARGAGNRMYLREHFIDPIDVVGVRLHGIQRAAPRREQILCCLKETHGAPEDGLDQKGREGSLTIRSWSFLEA
ncbi:hypothetical protein KC328_g121 [Hortaea werneckii]|nr:hypothetical protein KC328_g121 [Hortaea werneckii]